MPSEATSGRGRASRGIYVTQARAESDWAAAIAASAVERLEPRSTIVPSVLQNLPKSPPKQLQKDEQAPRPAWRKRRQNAKLTPRLVLEIRRMGRAVEPFAFGPTKQTLDHLREWRLYVVLGGLCASANLGRQRDITEQKARDRAQASIAYWLKDGTITEEEAASPIVERDAQLRSLRRVAHHFGISESHVVSVVGRKTWADVARGME